MRAAGVKRDPCSAAVAVAVPVAMASSVVDDNDLDPAKFLQSVRELSDRREREDLERFRKLEEDIAQGRQQRLERKLGT